MDRAATPTGGLMLDGDRFSRKAAVLVTEHHLTPLHPAQWTRE
jgi:hypothetical protein